MVFPLKKLLFSILVSCAVFFLIAGALIISDPPSDQPFAAGGGLNFSETLASGLDGLPKSRTYRARDGAMLKYRHYPSREAGKPRLYLVHGSGWHGMQFNGLAGRLSNAGVAEVFVPDLRGHGLSPQRRGDIDHIGQLEEDLADLMTETGKNAEGRAAVLAGHSSGGGLVVRFAGGEYGHLSDGFVLLAPFLKYNAPTTRPNSGGWARPLTRRIIGLTMLNAIGIRAFNNLVAIQFNMPQSVLAGPLGNTATTSYSYRLNRGFAPRSDYQSDLRAIDRPLLVVAGTDDEAFFADRFEPVISAETDSGRYALIDGANHLGVVNAPPTSQLIGDWIAARY